MKKTVFFFIIAMLAIFLVACPKTEEVVTVPVEEVPQEEVPAEVPTVPVTTTPSLNASTPGCIDSDNGLNTQFPGDVVDKTGEKFYDRCEDTRTLLERKCAKDGSVATSRVGCLYGCKDAACIPPPQEAEEPTQEEEETEPQGDFVGSTSSCTDNDGGLKYDVQGTCADASSSNLKDSCIGSDTIAEWSCSKSQNKCVQQTYSCNCATGACQ